MEYLKITLLSDLCVGNGESIGNAVDADVCMDRVGLPYIPARRLKGCLKQAALELEQMGYEGALQKRQKLFGDAYGEEGCLRVQDAVVKDAEILREFLASKIPADDFGERRERKIPDIVKRTAHVSSVARIFSTVRGQTRLEDGVKVDNTLRFTRVISRYDPFTLKDNSEMVFMAPVYLDTSDKKLHDFFEDCCRATRHIGTSRNRGLGNVSIAICEDRNQRKNDEANPEENTCEHRISSLADEEQIKISYRVALKAPVTLPGCDELNTSIPARSVIGCMAGNYLRKGSAEDRMFQDLFLNGNVRWSALTPVIDGVISDPAPMMLVKLKNDGNRLINHLSMEGTDWKGLKPKTLDGAFAAICSRHGEEKSTYIVAEPSIHTSYHYAINSTVHDRETSVVGSKLLYMQDSIDAGMIYGGTVTCRAKFAGEVLGCLKEAKLSFGRSRSAQYAVCSLDGLPQVEVVSEKRFETEAGETVYVILKSDLALQKEGIYVTGKDEIRKELAEKLNVSEKMPAGCQDYCRYHTIGGYQATWQLQKPQIPVIRAGSVYCFTASGESLPNMIQVGQFSQEGFGVCRIISKKEMHKLSSVKEGIIERVEKEGSEEHMYEVYVKLLAEAGLETMRRYALDCHFVDKGLPTGRLRLMLSEAREYSDLLRMIGTIKESDVSSVNEISRKKISESLVKEIYTEGESNAVSWKKLLEKEEGLWEEIQCYPEALKLLQKSWKLPMEIILHKLHYQKER